MSTKLHKSFWLCSLALLGIVGASHSMAQTIIMTTSRAVGETITLKVDTKISEEEESDEPTDVSQGEVIIDGIEESAVLGAETTYILTKQQITISGPVVLLHCVSNDLTAIDLSQSKPLRQLYCDDNHLTEIDLSNCADLQKLICYSNDLTALDLSHNGLLEWIDCYDNEVEVITFPTNAPLSYVDCSTNHIKEIDLSHLPSLVRLDCSKNQLTIVDLSHNGKLVYLSCEQNQIRGESMTKLISSLPMRQFTEPGLMLVRNLNSEDGNICLKSDVSLANQRGWVCQAKDGFSWVDYEGDPNAIDPVDDSDVLVYLNPTKTELYLERAEARRSVSVINILGEKLLDATTDGTGCLKIDIASLQAGTYLVCIGGEKIRQFIKE